MTDTPTLAAFTPEQINALPPETRDAFKNQLIAKGFDKAKVEASLGVANGAAASGTPPAATQTHPPGKDNRAAVENLKKHWTGDPAALEAGLKKAGLEPATDDRSNAEKSFDEGFAVPEAGTYRLNYTGRAIGDPAALAKLNGQYQEMFSSIALPGMAAQGVLDTMLDSSARFGRLKTEFQKKAYQYEQKETVERLGKDLGDLKTIMGFVDKALSRVKDQSFVLHLIDSGAMSAAATLHMARQGQRLAHREALAAKRGQK